MLELFGEKADLSSPNGSGLEALGDRSGLEHLKRVMGVAMVYEIYSRTAISNIFASILIKLKYSTALSG